MKKVIFFFVLMITTFCFGQNDNILAKEGNIVLEDNKQLPFINVKLINGSFHYTDIESGSEKQIAISEVKYIVDRQNSNIFTNKSVVERAKAKEEELIAKQKEQADLRRQEKLKLEESRKLKLVPDGIYFSKEDFLNGKPSSLETIVPKELIGFEKTELSGIPDACFFYYKNSDKKIKKVFAISYQGHLYFQIQAILNNRHKTDRAQTNDFPNSFTRVLSAGQNYYYVEATLINQWVQGLAYNTGATGVLIASDLSSANVQLGKTQNFGNIKGIVWDVKNKEFNIFKNCKDYNDFIKDIYPNGIQECDKHQPDITKIREVIEKIK